MDDINEYKKRKSFALEYGTILGATWILVFAAYIIGLTKFNFMAMLVCYAGFLGITYLPFYFANRYKTRHTIPEQEISYGQAFHFCLLMFCYAIIFTGIAEYIYFAYIDQGAVLNGLSTYLYDAETIRMLKENNMSDISLFMKNNLKMFSSLSPLDITLSLAQMNIMVSMLFTFIVAFFMKKKN